MACKSWMRSAPQNGAWTPLLREGIVRGLLPRHVVSTLENTGGSIAADPYRGPLPRPDKVRTHQGAFQARLQRRTSEGDGRTKTKGSIELELFHQLFNKLVFWRRVGRRTTADRRRRSRPWCPPIGLGEFQYVPA